MRTRPEDGLPSESRLGLSTLAATVALLALFLWRYGPLLLSLDTSFTDFEALHGNQLLTEGADTRLNAWILDWVLRTAFSAPATLLDTNAFFPAQGTLVGSEHLFGIALQTLPFRSFLSNAIAVHQFALVLSMFVLGVTSFAGVRALTGSDAAGFVAAAAAVMMPWRVTELSHLQLSSVQWFPAVWILLIRAVYRDVGLGERVLLGCCVALQLLSSFYLAYFLTLSSIVLLLLTGFGDAARRRRLPAIAASLAPGYALFGISALPYLARRAAADLTPSLDPTFSLGGARVWALLHPQLPRWLHETPAAILRPDPVYDIPAGVLLLALGAAVAAARSRAFSTELRAAVVTLWAISALGLILVFGGSLQVGDWLVPLPAQLLSAVVPGFDMLRGTVRWSILMGVALPLLAGLGVAAVRRIRGRALRFVTTAVAMVGLAATLDWFPIPARPAWPAPGAVATRYGALAALPPGPVVEIPFSRPFSSGQFGARALLASTLHRRPVVNGYTGYVPRSHVLLRRLGLRLPQPDAIAHFGRLTGARYFVVDLREISAREAAAWNQRASEGLLRHRFSDKSSRIYELRASAANGSGIAALLAPSPGPTTLSGLPRSRLALPPESGSLKVRAPARQFAGVNNSVRVRVQNNSALSWPSLDIHREGLVLVRYTWRPVAADTPIRTGVVSLDHDLTPGQTFHGYVSLAAPAHEGRYELCTDLVQQQGDQLTRLPVPASLHRVRLRRPAGLSGLAELIALSTPEPEPLAPCEPSIPPPI